MAVATLHRRYDPWFDAPEADPDPQLIRSGDLQTEVFRLSPAQQAEVVNEANAIRRRQVADAAQEAADELNGTPRRQQLMEQLDPERRAVLDRWADRLRGAGGLARNVLLPAAVLTPAALAAAGQGEEHGGAGAVVGGVSALAGGAGGMALGQELGQFAYPGSRGQMIGRILGALAGGGVGAMAGGGVNAAARGAVDSHEAGRGGPVAGIGQALDQLGYRSSADARAAAEEAAIRQAEASPIGREVKEAMRRQEDSERAAMVENLYMALLAQGAA